MPKATRQNLITLSATVTPEERIRFQQIASAKGKSIAALGRDAIVQYIRRHDRPQQVQAETELSKRLEKMDNSLRALLAKTVHLNGQILYISLIPYLKGGLPPKPLKKESYTGLWNESEKFAGAMLSKPLSEITAEQVDPEKPQA